MSEKYIATSMKKTAIGNKGEYIYEADQIISGTIDEETKVMTTDSGINYSPLLGKTDDISQEPYYANGITFSSFKEMLKNAPSFDMALKVYERFCDKTLYYESPKKSGGTSIIPFERDKLGEILNQILGKPVDNPSSSSQKDCSIDLTKIINQTTKSISNGNLSPDELIDLKIRLAAVSKEIPAALLAIDKQIDFYEKEIRSRTSKGNDIMANDQLKGKSPSDINIQDIFSKITKILIAQDRAVRRTIVEVSRLCDIPKKDYAILLTGDTGVGKTLLASLLGKYFSRPFLFIDSTQLTVPGYVGKDIEEYLWELYQDCGKDLALAERAIVYFDEIDKKGSSKKNDATGQGVLNTLLKFIDGVSYSISGSKYEQDRSVRISTNNMIVIAGGAFLDVYTKKVKRQIGFSPAEAKSEASPEPDISDFVAKGKIPKEFIARAPVIVHLDSLNIEGLKRILLEGDESTLKLQRDLFKTRGVILTPQESYIDEVSQQAIKTGTGGRGLNKIVLDTTWQAYEEVSNNPDVYEEVILTEETVRDPSNYQLVKKNHTSKQMYNAEKKGSN